MRIHHLDCGRLRLVGGRLLGDHTGGLARGEWVCHCVLVELDRGLLLIDTGLGTQALSRPDQWLGREWVFTAGAVLDPATTAVAQIEALGYAASDVRYIITTHLDLDHAGGLADFPDADVYLYAPELEALTKATGFEARRYRKVQFAHKPRFRPVSEHGDRWFGFDAVRSLPGLPESVLIVPLTGHSRGHAGVALDTGDGWLFDVGDAAYEPRWLDNVNPQRPHNIAALEWFGQARSDQRIHNLQRLRELQQGHGHEITLFTAHSRDQMEALQQRASV
ncbi:MBL fold metallo-hydrolase [Nocardia niigatensis]